MIFGIKLLTHQKMSSTHQKSTITAPKMIKKYFCVLTHQNNFISKVQIFLAKKCLKRTNLLPHQNFFEKYMNFTCKK
jgi:hypothetical protein